LEWDEVCKIANLIYSLLLQQRNILAPVTPTEANISRITDVLASRINGLGALPAINALYQFTRGTLAEVNQSNEPNLLLIAAKLEAIKQQYQAIIQSSQPTAIEPTLNSITAETVSSIVTSAINLLNRLKTEAEQSLEQLFTAQNNLETTQAPFAVLFNIKSYLEFEVSRLQ
jgi:hypothetical protein